MNRISKLLKPSRCFSSIGQGSKSFAKKGAAQEEQFIHDHEVEVTRLLKEKLQLEQEIKHLKSLKEQQDALKNPSLETVSNYTGTASFSAIKTEAGRESEYFRKQTNEKIKNLKHRQE